MSPSSKLAASLLSTALLFLAVLTGTARADTYTLYTVAHTDSENFVAGDDFGDYVLNVTDRFAYLPGRPLSCGGTSAYDRCYYVSSVGQSTGYYTTVVPTLPTNSNPAPGSGCDLPTGPQWEVGHTLCNNGHGLFFAFYDDGTTHTRGIFDGLDPLADHLSGGSIDGGFITPGGFAYFIDGLDDTLVVGAPLTNSAATPEPEALLLLGTGALPLLSLLRRRLPTTPGQRK